MIVGIVGGIGSGKTTVCKCLEKMNVQVYYADNEAKRVMEESSEIHQKLNATFGTVVSAQGVIDYALLGKIVFQDKSKLAQLNAIVHPKVCENFKLWVKKKRVNFDFLCIEAAVLFEAGLHTQVDKVVVVDADQSLRVERIVTRENITKTQALSRIRSQIDPSELIKKSDLVIDTNENKLLLPQIVNLYNKLKNGWLL